MPTGRIFSTDHIARRARNMLGAERLNTMIHLGCADPADFGSDHLWPRRGTKR